MIISLGEINPLESENALFPAKISANDVTLKYCLGYFRTSNKVKWNL